MIKITSDFRTVYSFLNENMIINLNIIGIIENEQFAEVYVDDMEKPTGVFVRLDYFHYMYTENDSFIEEVIERFFSEPGWYGFSGLYKPIADKIRGRFENTWESCCDIYYFPGSEFPKEMIKNTVRDVKIEDAEIVDRFYTYRNDESLDKIKKDIQNRPSSAIYNDNEIASWVLVHNDNSMGIMFTKEEHRNKGYAVDVTLDLISKIIKMGKKPFLQINIFNNMSPGLALKCGFVKNERSDWFGFIVGNPKEIIDGAKESRDKFIEAFREEKMDKLVEKVLENSLNPQGMHLFLMNMKEEKSEIPNFSIEKVSELKQKEVWCKIAAGSYDVPCDIKQEFENLLNRVAISEKYSFNLYIGLLNGIPVSTIAIQNLDAWTSGISLLSSVQLPNRQSIYSAFIRKVLIEEKSKGRELVFVHTTEIHVETLKEIGFRG